MDLIEIPQEHALVQLSSIEILALWRAISRARDSMTDEQFIDSFDTTRNHATELCRKLSEALDWARANRPD
jgi:hypothetical protein